MRILRTWRRAVPLAALAMVALNVGCSDDAQPLLADSFTAKDGGVGQDQAPLPADQSKPDAAGSSALGCKAGTCPPCAGGKVGCAAKGPFIPGTCCAKGDNLVQEGTAKGYEPVGMAFDGRVLAVCGGIGIDISDLANPASPKVLGLGHPRCQNAAFGTPITPGMRVVYAAHHGDGNLWSSSIDTYHVDLTGGYIKKKSQFRENGVALGGLAYHKGRLYVAGFSKGLLVLEADSQGKLTRKATITAGLKNVWKVRLGTTAAAAYAYVIDADLGLHVFSLAQPDAPKLLATVATTGSPRELAVGKDRVYVAMGGLGIDMFDVSTPAKPKKLKSVGGYGSAQSLALVGDVLAVAAWNHLEVRDPKTLALLGTERMARAFEEDVAVAALDKDTIMVAEWERVYLVGYRQGLVAPNIYLPDESLSIAPGKAAKYALEVRNIGPVDLKVSSLSVSNNMFTVANKPMTIKPGDFDVFEVGYTPHPTATKAGTILLKTNDPDKYQSDLKIDLQVQDVGTGHYLEGDKLDSKLFGFLDPKGTNNVNALKGKVTVLAYFALY